MEYKKRTRNFYDPHSKTPFNISRSKIDLFLECPLCFYLDRRLGVGRPSMPAFTLNVAVDRLLKKEFDIYRAKKEAHPLMKRYKISAVPFAHADLDLWRENFTGVRFYHPETNLIISGAGGDVHWEGSRRRRSPRRARHCDRFRAPPRVPGLPRLRARAAPGT